MQGRKDAKPHSKAIGRYYLIAQRRQALQPSNSLPPLLLCVLALHLSFQLANALLILYQLYHRGKRITLLGGDGENQSTVLLHAGYR